MKTLISGLLTLLLLAGCVAAQPKPQITPKPKLDTEVYDWEVKHLKHGRGYKLQKDGSKVAAKLVLLMLEKRPIGQKNPILILISDKKEAFKLQQCDRIVGGFKMIDGRKCFPWYTKQIPWVKFEVMKVVPKEFPMLSIPPGSGGAYMGAVVTLHQIGKKFSIAINIMQRRARNLKPGDKILGCMMGPGDFAWKLAKAGIKSGPPRVTPKAAEE